jgi:serine/threonine-protein kinase
MADEERTKRADDEAREANVDEVDVDATTRLGGGSHDAPPEDEPTRVVADSPSADGLEHAPTQLIDDDEEVEEPKTEPPPADEPDVADESDSDVDIDGATRAANRSYSKDRAAAPPSGKPVPGSILFGEYEIIEVLGAGGMGEVYRARHRKLDEYRAIKMMHAELSNKRGANEFFLREAKALLAVRHPAVVHCHDLLSDEQGRVYLIMEMIEGISLADRMEDGPLPPDDVVLLGARLAAGLEAAHKCKVVHRDISPDNIVLPDGNVREAKLIDFGIAKLLQEGQGTIVEGFKGKLGYASPEQLGFFGGKIDGRSDFYSLGLVLCAAALGRPLGMGTTVMEAVDARRHLRRIPDEIPVGLRSAIEPLLALDPQDRPTMVGRLFMVPGSEQPGLEPLGAGAGVAQPVAVTASKAPLITMLAAGALAVVGIGGYFLIDGGSSERGEATSVTEQKPGSASAGDPSPGAALDSGKMGTDAAGRPDASRSPSTGGAPTKAAGFEAPAKSAPAAAKPARRKITALDKVRIVGLLRGAETALEENRLQSPSGNNAYEKYRTVLDMDPSNKEAQQGLVDVASRYLVLTERALSTKDLATAKRYLSKASSIAPHHPRLGKVRAKVDSAAAASPTG